MSIERREALVLGFGAPTPGAEFRGGLGLYRREGAPTRGSHKRLGVHLLLLWEARPRGDAF